MTTLLVIIGLTIALLFVAIRLGRQKERTEQNKTNAEQAKEILDASVNSPKSLSDVRDRLRDKGRF